jgi:putative two-component system response regulator
MNTPEPITMNTAKSGAILVVDDIATNRDLLMRRLQPLGFEMVGAGNGKEALELLTQQAFDLVLLDVMMPIMDGFELLERIKRSSATRHIPVVMITAMDDVESAARCIEMGAEDYLAKPFNPVLLRARVEACLERKRLHDQEARYRSQIEQYNDELENRVRRQVYELSEAQLAAIFAMSKLAESRDPETGEHLERMREYCRVLSEQLSRLPKYQAVIDRTFIDNIYAASPLHDIGKVGVDDSVLLKPGTLSEEDWRQMRRHPLIGAATLREVDRQHPGNAFIRSGIDIAEYHHEKWDGSGYPYGAKGESIPLMARILALGDVYDALTSRRCYKQAFGHEKSRAIILEGKGRHFDPDVVQAFLDTEQEFQRIRLAFQDPDEE